MPFDVTAAFTCTALLAGGLVGFVIGDRHGRAAKRLSDAEAAAELLSGVARRDAVDPDQRPRRELDVLRDAIRAGAREQRDRAAAHEAGHTVVGWHSGHYVSRILSVTITPSEAGYAGVVMARYAAPPLTNPQRWDGLAFQLGGLAGEALLHGRGNAPTAAVDLRSARVLAEELVSAGMPKPWWGGNTFASGPVIDVGSMFKAAPDMETRAVLDAGYRRARWILNDREGAFVRLVRVLLRRQTVTGDELVSLMLGGKAA